MFDNICSLPLSADLFTQAIHPTEPILSVGLSSGHVQTFRLPSIDTTSATNLQKQNGHVSPKFAQNGAVKSNLRRLSEDGFDTIDTVWRTRRHKGSCRALAFSRDGSILFSAGSDGIVKAAPIETGRVMSKIAIPSDPSSKELELPSILHTLSPQTLLIGTDNARLHIYDLRQGSVSSRPEQTLRPHVTEDDPTFAEPLSSLTALPPTLASTSGESKAWITTAGSTLAVSDLRKGVVSTSEDQGDELLSSVCIVNSHSGAIANGTSSDGNSEKFAVGGAKGTVTLWERGQWQDARSRITVHRDTRGLNDDGTIDFLAVVPDYAQPPGYGLDGMLAAGLGNGKVQFVSLRGWGGRNATRITHEEDGIDGVAAINFDISGRMITGGGQIVKIWHAKAADERLNGASSEDEDDEDELGEQDFESSEDELEPEAPLSSSDSEEEKRARKKQKKKDRRSKGKDNSNHGITAFKGLE